jgi:group I intron endonuclease
MADNKSGIYQIRNTENDKIYIGSAVNVSRRKSKHFSTLKRKVHRNIHLQRSYDKHGERCFIFEVLEYVEDKQDLIRREQYWIDLKNPEYNIARIAGSCLGTKRSKETCRKISKANSGKNCYWYGKRGEETPNYGRKHSEETKRKISEASKRQIRKKAPKKRNKQTASKEKKKKVLSKEHRQKKSKALKSRKTSGETKKINKQTAPKEKKKKVLSEEHKRKLSVIFKGRVLSEEWKKKISDSNKFEKHSQTKFTWEIIREIREKYKSTSQGKLALMYGVSRSAIQAIVLNKSWHDSEYIPIRKK